MPCSWFSSSVSWPDHDVRTFIRGSEVPTNTSPWGKRRQRMMHPFERQSSTFPRECAVADSRDTEIITRRYRSSDRTKVLFFGLTSSTPKLVRLVANRDIESWTVVTSIPSNTECILNLTLLSSAETLRATTLSVKIELHGFRRIPAVRSLFVIIITPRSSVVRLDELHDRKQWTLTLRDETLWKVSTLQISSLPFSAVWHVGWAIEPITSTGNCIALL